MKSFLLLASFLTVSLIAYPQTEKGYYISQSGEMINCLIEIPESFTASQTIRTKSLSNGSIKILSSADVREFGIPDLMKYVKAEIHEGPVRKTLFLRMIVEGKASLYSLENKNSRSFYFNLNNEEIKQLIPGNQHNSFRQQLLQKMVCGGGSELIIEKMDLKEKSLISFFTDYNYCKGNLSKNYTVKNTGPTLFFKVTPGLNIAQMKAGAFIGSVDEVDFGTNQSFRMGIETEYFFLEKKYFLSVFADPNYQYLKVEKNNPNQPKVTLTYSVIELPFGVRYNQFFRDRSSRIFFNAGMLLDVRLNAAIRIDGNAQTVPVDSWFNFIGGVGYSYKNKASLEVRYTHYDDLTKSHNLWTGTHQALSLIVGVAVFSKK